MVERVGEPARLHRWVAAVQPARITDQAEAVLLVGAGAQSCVSHRDGPLVAAQSEEHHDQCQDGRRGIQPIDQEPTQQQHPGSAEDGVALDEVSLRRVAQHLGLEHMPMTGWLAWNRAAP